MIRELLIHNVNREYEARNTKYSSHGLDTLTANPTVNLPTVLMMCELLIHKIIKEIEE